jgi:hypothetical protein
MKTIDKNLFIEDGKVFVVSEVKTVTAEDLQPLTQTGLYILACIEARIEECTNQLKRNIDKVYRQEIFDKENPVLFFTDGSIYNSKAMKTLIELKEMFQYRKQERIGLEFLKELSIGELDQLLKALTCENPWDAFASMVDHIRIDKIVEQSKNF